MKRIIATAIVLGCLAMGLSLWMTSGPALRTDSSNADDATARATAPWLRTRPAGGRSPWSLGTARRYSVATEGEAELGGEDSGEGMFFGVEGELTLTVAAHDEESLQLRGRFAPGSFSLGSGAADSAGASAAETALRPHLARPFHVSIDAAGRVTGLRFAPGTDQIAMGMLRSLMMTAQFVRPAETAADAAAWTTLELDPVGQYEASYTRADDGGYLKTKPRYVQLAAETGLVPAGNEITHLDFHGRYRIGEAGELVSLEAEEQMGRRMGDMFQADGKSRTTIQLLDTGEDADGVVAFRAESARMQTVTATELMVPADAAHQHLVQLLGGATLPELIGRLEKFDLASHANDRLELISQMSALLALDPDATDDIASTMRGLDPERAALAVSALSNAGTPQAQRVLVDVMQDTSADAELRQRSAALLGMVETPTPETAAAIEKLAAEPGDMRSTATLAMGNVADGLDPAGADARRIIEELARRLAAATTSGEKQLTLAALGNTAHPLIVDVVRPYLSNPSPELRLAAVQALRLVDDAGAFALLATALLGDADAVVRAGAARAMDYLPVPAHLDAAVRSIASEKDPYVRKEVVILVAARYAQHPAGRELLAQVAASDPSPEVRAAATPQGT